MGRERGLPTDQGFQQLEDWKEGLGVNLYICKYIFFLVLSFCFGGQCNFCPNSLFFQELLCLHCKWPQSVLRLGTAGGAGLGSHSTEKCACRAKAECSCPLLALPVTLGQFSHPLYTTDTLIFSLSWHCLACFAQGCCSVLPSNFCDGSCCVWRCVCISGPTGADQVQESVPPRSRPSLQGRYPATPSLWIVWELLLKPLAASLWYTKTVGFYNSSFCWVVNIPLLISLFPLM